MVPDKQESEKNRSEKDTENQEKSKSGHSGKKVAISLLVLVTLAGILLIIGQLMTLGHTHRPHAQAGIDFVTNEDREVINISLTTMGNADYVILKNVSGMEFDGSIKGSVGEAGMMYFGGETSEPIRLSPDPNSSSGKILAVAVIGEPPEKFAVGNSEDEVAIAVSERLGDREVITTVLAEEYDFE